MRDVPKLKLVGLVILILLVFYFAPVVPYVQSVDVPGSAQASSLWGFATPSYALLGSGSAPYSSAVLVSNGDHSAVVFFDGSRAVAMEDAGPAGVELNPQETIWIQDAEVTSFDFGFLNITVHVQNLALDSIDGANVYLTMAGFSANSTAGGLTLIQPKLVGSCGQILPGGSCTVTGTTPNTFPANRSINFYPEVRGSVNGVPFIYRQGFSEGYPTGGVGPIWVSTFMKRVDHARGSPLVENSTLDRFAALRFNTASAHYQTSDYGFANDTSAFFSPTEGKSVTEELLFPGAFSPDSYPTYLAEYAPGHWETLQGAQYSQFGFYVGHGPYYEVEVPCSIYEVPAAGINIPQFFQARGCTTTVIPSTWLVVILAP